MARNLPDAAEHMACYKRKTQERISVVVAYVEKFKPAAAALFAADYDEIKKCLKGSGFDVERGFKVAGTNAQRYEGS